MHEHFWRRLALLNADVCVTEIFCHSSCEFFWCLRHYVCNLSTCLCVHATVPKQRHSSTFFLSTYSCLQVRESEISIISRFCALYAVAAGWQAVTVNIEAKLHCKLWDLTGILSVAGLLTSADVMCSGSQRLVWSASASVHRHHYGVTEPKHCSWTQNDQ